MDFSHLFVPLPLGHLTLPNRLVAGPVVSNTADERGYVTPKMVEYYRDKARGGWGLLNVEAAYVRLNGPTFNRMLGIYSPRQVSGLNELADAIHEEGALCSLQIMHGGRGSFPVWIDGQRTVAPSGNLPPLNGVQARELEPGEIEEYVEDFVNAAAWTREAGFDAVVLHGTHGFLINQFMSRHTNRREDEWGDPLAFPLAIVRGIRDRLGRDYPIIFRLTGDEFMGKDGSTLEDAVGWAPELVRAGVDALDVSAGNRETSRWSIQPASFERGCLVHLAHAIKKTVDVPVFTAGRINDPGLALRIVQEGRADLVIMARGALCDPLMPKKLAGEVPETPRRCLACNECLDRVRTQRVVRCLFNFALGRSEADTRIRPAPKGGHVVVVGAGPGGLEAARVARLRGFDVTLYERSREIGGAVRLAMKPPNKNELANIVDYYAGEMDRLGVDLRFGQTPRADRIAALSPVAVFLATGARPYIPPIPGAEAPHVVHANRILAGEVDPGREVVVIGGAEVGCETAELLANQGARVTLMRRKEMLAEDVEPVTRNALLERLKAGGVSSMLGVRYQRIDADGVVILDADGRERKVAADQVVLATGYRPDDRLLDPFEEAGLPVLVVGDAKKVGRIIDAIHGAALAVRRI